jgi:tryptophan 2,3-dioxygenase
MPMDKTSIDQKILEKIKLLEEKFAITGQDLDSYLEGLLYSNYLRYWDYIELDTLLSLQKPRTNFPDEHIFIIYHQITELYFKLIRLEMDQLSEAEVMTGDNFLMRLKRINRYFVHLTDSFEVMTDGMEQAQFLKFRMALLPASGFQSAQYRFIEIGSTDLYNLTSLASREQLSKDDEAQKLYEHIYWKQGATELSTGKKTLSLIHFEEKYSEEFVSYAQKVKTTNLWRIFKDKLQDTENKEQIIEALRTFDELANVHWPLVHFKSAVRYLQRDPEVIAATGGTNWQKYLPPRFQKVIFYPELWSEKEKDNWGRSWVMKNVLKKAE